MSLKLTTIDCSISYCIYIYIWTNKLSTQNELFRGDTKIKHKSEKAEKGEKVKKKHATHVSVTNTNNFN